MIECVTKRLCDHTTADDSNRYREPIDNVSAYDPLLRFHQWLIAQGFSQDSLDDIQRACQQKIEEACQ